jgi:hypothetical protein
VRLALQGRQAQQVVLGGLVVWVAQVELGELAELVERETLGQLVKQALRVELAVQVALEGQVVSALLGSQERQALTVERGAQAGLEGLEVKGLRDQPGGLLDRQAQRVRPVQLEEREG